MGKTAFVDGNPSQGVTGTTVTAAFLNALQNHRHDGLDQDGSCPTSFVVASGSANTYTAAFSPALTAHCPGLPLLIQAPATNTGASTFNPNSLGAKSIVRQDGSVLQAGDIVSGGVYQLIYDGTNYQVAAVSTPVSIQGLFKNLIVSASGSAAAISVSCDEIVVGNGVTYQTIRSVNLSIAGTTNGANGLDTGTLAASTWYSIWVIRNGSTGTTAGLMSLSATAPTMPSGYTHKARIGWIRTDSTANKYPLSFKQYGRNVRYVVAGNVSALPTMASGNNGSITTPTWVSVSTANFIPSTASIITLATWTGGTDSSTVMVAPNTNYGAMTSTTNPPLATVNQTSATLGGFPVDILLESTNIYIATYDQALIQCYGWEDNL